ncbi:MAG: hypothetical protein JSU00_27710 [Acidobacteria bacterium]|nr:hypothetical protein [Acidobacteriota bacterium]
MLKLLPILLVPASMLAADPAGFALWKSADLKSQEKKLSSKLDAQKAASQPLGKFDGVNFTVSHREGSGVAELHEKVADLFVVVSGEATLIVGGKMVDSKSTGPGEARGSKIDGGTKHALAAGDTVRIPANTPHQLLLDAGKQFTYFVVKVDVK